MGVDSGNQTVTVLYYSQVTSPVVNRLGQDVRKPGIYSGGYLTKVSDTSVSVSTFTAEIGDGTYQVRCATGSAVTVTVSTTNIYVVLRWTYTGSATNDYVEFVATNFAGILSTDVIVGKCLFAGSTLTTFDYGYDTTNKITNRTTPNVQDLFLKVEQMETASMYVRVRAGKANYGTANYDISDQTVLLTAPVSNSRIDLVQINASGSVVITQGTIAASPVAPSYGNLITLAEITLTTGMTQITSSLIKDVRSFIGSGLNNVVRLTDDQTVAGTKTFTSFSVTPSSAPTNNYHVSNKKYVDDKFPTSSVSGIIGSRSDKSSSYGAQQATTDGFVEVVASWGDGGVCDYMVEGFTDSATNPTIRKGLVHIPVIPDNGAVRGGSFCMFVKKNEHWKVVRTVTGTPTSESLVVYFTPLGA